MTELLTIILAAGEGTRMKSARPKVLHEVAGRSIVGHVVAAAAGAGATEVAVITGPGHAAVRENVSGIFGGAVFFEQKERRGTAHAAREARALFEKAKGYVAVVYGDHPLLRPQNFRSVIEKLDAGFDGAIMGFEPSDPTGYGRFLVEGELLRDIREHKDASEEERKIGLCNACALMFRADVFRELIDKIDDKNAQSEFYIGDLVPLANQAGYRITYSIEPEEDVMGVNSRAQLAHAEAVFQDRLRAQAMADGVTLVDPETVYFAYDTQWARDVTIEPNVYFGTGVSIAENVTIHGFSHIDGATIGAGAQVGPFARLRPAAVLDAAAKVGNFCEVKKANIGAGAKVNHLTYVGDADVGAKANLGAGTITCNYDGVNKHRTEIGVEAFIGSNASLVAPVKVGKGAYVASGSVITRDVAPDALAFGRARQENKPGLAVKIRERALALKAQLKGNS